MSTETATELKPNDPVWYYRCVSGGGSAMKLTGRFLKARGKCYASIVYKDHRTQEDKVTMVAIESLEKRKDFKQ